jgi:hypothetical protein
MARVTLEGIGEIDEEDLRASVKLRNTVGAWMKNPRARRKMLEAHKEFDPKADIPELDQPDPLEQKVAPLTADIAALRKELADAKEAAERERSLGALKRSIEDGFERLRRTEGLTAQGEEAINKLMEEKGITDPEIAYSHFIRMHPPQALATSGSSGLFGLLEPQPDTETDIKALVASRGESSPVVDKMIRDALTEFRGQTVKR